MPRSRWKRAGGLAAFALAATLAIFACSDGGGGSPTAPTVVEYPLVAGSWSGDWVVVELEPATVRATLSQDASAVTGTFDIDDLPVPVEGTLSTRDAAGVGQLSWHVPDSALDCGLVRGSLTVSRADTKMQGSATASTVGCDGPLEIYEGVITLSRLDGAGSFDPGHSQLAERLQRLLRGKDS